MQHLVFLRKYSLGNYIYILIIYRQGANQEAAAARLAHPTQFIGQVRTPWPESNHAVSGATGEW